MCVKLFVTEVSAEINAFLGSYFSSEFTAELTLIKSYTYFGSVQLLATLSLKIKLITLNLKDYTQVIFGLFPFNQNDVSKYVYNVLPK